MNEKESKKEMKAMDFKVILERGTSLLEIQSEMDSLPHETPKLEATITEPHTRILPYEDIYGGVFA